MIITADKIITGDGITVLSGYALLMDDKKIKRIAPIEEIKVLAPDQDIRDYGNSTILPGLIDMHVHLCYPWGEEDASLYDDYLSAYLTYRNAVSAFSSGVTTIRDASSPKGSVEKLRYAAEKGFFTVPRIFHCGQGLCMTGGHGWELGGGCAEIDGADNLRTEIRRQFRDGADFIKLMSSHRSSTPEYTQEELDAAVNECHRVGRKIAVHSGTQPSIQMCIDAGFDSIEHGTYMTLDQAKQMKEKGIVWVPTIVAYTYVYEYCINSGYTISSFDYFEDAAMAYKNNFKALYDTGVTVLAGTDMVLSGAPPTPVSKELEYMVRYGMSSINAIKAATSAPAEYLGISNTAGTLADGKAADILIVNGDAEKDICSLQKVNTVFFGGKQVFKGEKE